MRPLSYKEFLRGCLVGKMYEKARYDNEFADNLYFHMGARNTLELFQNLNTPEGLKLARKVAIEKGIYKGSPQEKLTRVFNVLIRNSLQIVKEDFIDPLTTSMSQEAEEQPEDRNVYQIHSNMISPARAGARLAARGLMRDPQELQGLHERDKKKYGQEDGPSYDNLWNKYYREPTPTVKHLFKEAADSLVDQQTELSIAFAAVRGDKGYNDRNGIDSSLDKFRQQSSYRVKWFFKHPAEEFDEQPDPKDQPLSPKLY